MSGLQITIEGISEELRSAYLRSGMKRADGAGDKIAWTFGSDMQDSFCVARQNGEIVGVSAYIRDRFILGDKRGQAVQAVDSFVFPAARGKGLFHRLAAAYSEYAKQRQFDVIWGFPNDNARQAWFGKQGWTFLGQVPILIRLLRTGPILRKLKLPGNFSVYFGIDQNLDEIISLGEWFDATWERQERNLRCGRVRDRTYLSRRLFECPEPKSYRVVADPTDKGALLATRNVAKHGMHMAYVMEALGESETLSVLLRSELARMRDTGTEAVLAWSYPGMPNYKALRSCGFFPLPEQVRPFHIWFGSYPLSRKGIICAEPANWYLSYLDSDTV